MVPPSDVIDAVYKEFVLNNMRNLNCPILVKPTPLPANMLPVLVAMTALENLFVPVNT